MCLLARFGRRRHVRLWLRRHHNDYRLLSRFGERYPGFQGLARRLTKEGRRERRTETPCLEPESAWKPRTDYHEMVRNRSLGPVRRVCAENADLRKYSRWRNEPPAGSTDAPQPRYSADRIGAENPRMGAENPRTCLEADMATPKPKAILRGAKPRSEIWSPSLLHNPALMPYGTGPHFAAAN
jgi:hypothetical protein